MESLQVWSFPYEFSPFSYNETIAEEYVPISKEEVEEKGYCWSDYDKSSCDITKKSLDLLDYIKDVSDDILEEILGCNACGRGYKIIHNELTFLKHLGLPLPRSCPECRHKDKFMEINKPKFYSRKCDRCKKYIRTAFSINRLEIVYCEKCSQREFL